jgi:hypothetical protein
MPPAGSVTILAPQTGILPALPGTVAVKAGIIPFRLLDCPHKVTLFCLAYFNVMSLGNVLYFGDFHVGISFIGSLSWRHAAAYRGLLGQKKP